VNLSREDLLAAARDLVPEDRAEALWDRLEQRAAAASGALSGPAAPARLRVHRSGLAAAFATLLLLAAFGPSSGWSPRAFLAITVGLLGLGAGFALDRRTSRDLAGALYFAGIASIWVGTFSHAPAGAPGTLLQAAIFAWLLSLALLLRRASFAVAGALGLATLAGQLADELLVPAAVPAVAVAAGLALLGGAGLWARHAPRASSALHAHLPAPLRRLLPPGVA
jgi:hypothetical protein